MEGNYQNLRFAVDVALMVDSFSDLRDMIHELNIKSEIAGLSINLGKSSTVSKLKQSWKPHTQVKYSLSNKKMDKEINRRINAAWSKFQSLRRILKGNLKLYHEGEIHNMGVLPTLTYGCRTWTHKNKLLAKIRVTENLMLRSILGVRQLDKNQNKVANKPNS